MKITVARNGMTTTLAYNEVNELTSESHSGGTLNGLAVTRGYDALGRRTSLSLNTQAPGINYSYGYNSANGRLETVTSGNYMATYSYLANSPLVSQIVFQDNGATRMTTARQYDKLNRLQSISSTPSGAGQMPLGFRQGYDAANQRNRVNLPDGSYWVYEYDALGQVKAGKKYFADNTPVPGQQFEYTHDDIGNRTATKAGGDQYGQNLRSATYGPNSLNQYTYRTVPGYADVLGIAVSTNEVAINGDTSNYRRGDYFHKALAISNTGTNPAVAWTSVTANNTTQEGKLLLPPATQEFRYDADGNLTNDFVWCYAWDGENRLIQQESVSGLASTNRFRLAYEYDWQGRRIRKTVTRLDTSAVILDNKFLYDGWKMVAELNATNNTVIRSYLWGTDLSGTLQGAGGVGGLLAVNNVSQGTFFPSFDGNGNVAAYLKSDAYGTNWVRYEYGPFAESIRISGTVANPATVSPFLFSTKYQDEETDSLYYGHRYLKDGRWLNRDPIEEGDGPNIYAFLRNDGLNKIDFLGLEWIIKREGKSRAEAWATSSSDTFDGLARKIRLDTSDYKKWVQTSDDKPDPCKKYSIPNTIYIDLGLIDRWDMIPWTVLSIWRSQANRDKADWESKGFLVPMNEAAIDAEITSHLGSPNTHGYVFIGHGADPGIINAYSHLGEDMSGTTPDRYTSHGIAFLTLKACYSAAKSPTPGKRYKYNAWESNVATRGWFVGYEGSVHTLNELFQWAAARGQNNKP